MTFLPLAFVALVLLGCGGAPFQTGEDTRPDLSDALPAPEASTSPSDGGAASVGLGALPGPSDSSASTSLPGDAGPSSLSDLPDASLDSSPDAESTSSSSSAFDAVAPDGCTPVSPPCWYTAGGVCQHVALPAACACAETFTCACLAGAGPSCDARTCFDTDAGAVVVCE